MTVERMEMARTVPEAQAKLDAVVYSQMRSHVGRHTLTEVVTTERTASEF